MRKSPYPPCHPALELQPAEIDHCGTPADGREVAGMPVAKRARAYIALEPPFDGARHVDTLLLGRRGDARSLVVRPYVYGDRVADGKNICMARTRQVCLDSHPARGVSRYIEPKGRRRSSHPGRPNSDAGGNGCIADPDTLGIAVGYGGT